MQTSAARCTSGMTAICSTSGARRRRSITSDTSWFIGAVSHVRMGASDGSLILTSIWKGWYERQFRRPLSSDRRRDLRTEPRGISTERTERLGHCAVRWYENVHQQVPAVRCRRNVLDEQIVQAVVGVSIREREIQR